MKKLQRWLTLVLWNATQWLWRLGILALILLAIFISVGREMAPLLKENKSWLERHLTALSGYPVQMASVEAQWEGLMPELRTTRLSIGDTITVDRALLRVDLLRSAWHRALVFDVLTIQGAMLEIPVTENESPDKQINIQTGLNFLFGSANVRLRDVSLRLQRAAGEELLIKIPALDVGNAGTRHWLQGSFRVADAVQPIEIAGAFTGSATDILAGHGNAYLDFGDGSKLRKVAAFLVNDPDVPVSVGNPGGIQGRLWLEWRDNQLDWTAAVNLHNLNLHALDYRLSYAGNLTGTLRVHGGILDSLNGLSGYELTVGVPQGELVINQQTYPVPDWGLHYLSRDVRRGGEATVSLHIPAFDLSDLEDYRQLVTHAELRKVLQTLQPRGILRHVHLLVPLDKTSVLKPVLRANLEQVSVAAWQSAPALEKVDAYLEANAEAGFVEVTSEKGFGIHFPDLYANAMTYERVRGRVYWHINPASQVVSVGSTAIDLVGEDGKGHAAFWVDIPPAHSPRASEMYLTVGLKNSKASYRHKYLPGILPRDLLRWLNTSIKAGDVVENGFIYRGSLRSGEEQERSILYFGRFQDGILKFDPAWPPLLDVETTVLVDNGEVYADVAEAQLQGVTLKKATIGVKSGNFLTIQGEVEGKGNKALDILRKTPLRNTLGSTFDNWALEDDISGHISLGISLDKNTHNDLQKNDFQEVAIELDDNDLRLKDIALSLDRLSGDLYYSSSLGLSASSLSARLWGQSQAVSIVPVVDQDGLPDILINTSGVVEPARLAAWSHLSFIQFLQGSIPVQGKLEIPLDAGDSPDSTPFATLGFFSDLQGVALDLPAPLKKPANTAKPLVVKVDLFKDHQAYNVLYSSQAAARIEIPAEGMLRGQVWLNQPADETMEALPAGLNIHGHLEKAILDDWIKVINRYGKLEAGKPVVPATASKSETPSPVFDVSLDDFQIGELALGETRLSVFRVEDDKAWYANFDHGAANGQYRYFDNTVQLPELAFNRLDLDEWQRLHGGNPAEEETVNSSIETPDPLGNIIPQELPALKVSTKKLVHDGTDLGEWRVTIRPQPWGALLEGLTATMPGVTIGAISGDQGANVLWRRDAGVMETEISARIVQTSQSGAVKSLFGTERIVEADKTELAANLAWKGSPVNMQFRNLKGDVRVSSEKGVFLNSSTKTDLMKVINVFNFNTWARRLKLDFSDLYKKGVSYDRVDGHVQLDHGKVIFDKPLVMASPSSRFVLQGSINSVKNSIDADLSVTLPVSDNAAWVTALAGGLPAAVGVWAVSKIFEKQIDNLSSVSYTISGELDNPDIRFKHMLKDLPGKNKQAPVLPLAPTGSAD